MGASPPEKPVEHLVPAPAAPPVQVKPANGQPDTAADATGSTASPLPDDDSERDLWWGAYAGRAILPSVVFCVVLTALITAGAAFLWLAYGVRPLRIRYTAYGFIGTLWLLQGSRWAYLLFTFSYRLTTRRVWCERPFVYVPARYVDLPRIVQVVVDKNALDRLLHLGRISILTEPHAEPSLVLLGIYEPERIAGAIRSAVKEALANQDARGQRGSAENSTFEQ
jgi:hypothetical protein